MAHPANSKFTVPIVGGNMDVTAYLMPDGSKMEAVFSFDTIDSEGRPISVASGKVSVFKTLDGKIDYETVIDPGISGTWRREWTWTAATSTTGESVVIDKWVIIA